MKRAVAVVLVFAFVFPGSIPAGANVITRKDGNDTPGPLDLAGLRISHDGGDQIFKISTLAHFSNAQVDGTAGWFEVDFDLNADRKYSFITYVFFAAGKMRGVLIKANGDLVTRNLQASRTSSSATVRVPLAKIGRPKSYDVAVFSVYRASPCSRADPCVDGIPSYYPLIRHDLTPPTVKWIDVAIYTSDASDTYSFPVEFSVKDDQYGSGVKRWKLQWRTVFPEMPWSDVKSGTALHPTVTLDGYPGENYDLRVVATDKQDNTSTSAIKRVTVPADDAYTVGPIQFTYTGSWTAATAVSGALLGTTHAGAVGAEAATDFSAGQHLCILGGPTTGATAEATLLIGGVEVATLIESGSTGARARLGCVDTGSLIGAVHVVVHPTTAEPFILDGIVVRR